MTNTQSYLVLLLVLIMGPAILGSSISYGAEKCYREGTIVTYQCEVPALPGTLDWNGIGFDCPSKTGTTVTNNTIALSVEPLTVCSASSKVKIGTCGPYFANLTCAEDGMHVTSVLEFQANYEMNEGNIYCFFHGRNETFVVQVGVTPNPPSHVRVTLPQPDKSVHFEWNPPINESVGGIEGYKISYGENCGNCTPEAGFVNQTEELTADCSKYTEENTENNMCYFEVSTVSEDCSFDSLPVEATSETPINSRNGSTVSITCSLTPNPPIYVEWNYTFSEESRREFSGFLITISDQSGHSVEDILSDSKIRQYYVNSTVLKATDDFAGDIWNITVEVAFGENKNKFTFDSISFSVEDTIMIDPSSAITPDQCIEVSINSHCDERSDTFQAQVQFIEGSCESDHELTNTTSNYTLEDYKTCVPVVAGTICYSTVIFHNELELGRTERQELILLPCILKTSNSTRVNINSTIGEIPRGIEMIPHNTKLYFFCDFNCTIDQSQSRCANGTFQPSISHILQDGCRCSDNLKLIIIGSSAVVLLLVVVVIILGVCLCCRRRKNSADEDFQSVEPDPDDRDRGASNVSYINIELQQTITQNSVSIN